MSRSRSRVTPMLGALAVVAALHGWARHAASFVPVPPQTTKPSIEANSRRAAALTAALPVLGGAPLASLAEASGREVAQSGNFAFTMPAGNEFKIEPSDPGSVMYTRKDGAIIAVGPILPGFFDTVIAEAKAFSIRGPPGRRIVTNTRSDALDELVIDEYPLALETAGEGPFNIIGLGRKESWRFWFRNVKDGEKGVMMRIIVPLKRLQDEEAAMEDVLKSLRLA